MTPPIFIDYKLFIQWLENNPQEVINFGGTGYLESNDFISTVSLLLEAYCNREKN